MSIDFSTKALCDFFFLEPLSTTPSLLEQCMKKTPAERTVSDEILNRKLFSESLYTDPSACTGSFFSPEQVKLNSMTSDEIISELQDLACKLEECRAPSDLFCTRVGDMLYVVKEFSDRPIDSKYEFISKVKMDEKTLELMPEFKKFKVTGDGIDVVMNTPKEKIAAFSISTSIRTRPNLSKDLDNMKVFKLKDF